MSMSTTTDTPSGPAVRQPGLLARVFGVLFSPRDTYAAVAARPRALGALAIVGLITVACQAAFLSTDVGRDIALDAQVKAMEAFGVTITDQMYDQMATGIERARFINPVATLIFIPIINAALAGVLLVIFSMLLGGSATFKHVNAVTAHAGVIIALQQLFGTPLSYARGEMAGANLGVFVPMLDETNFFAILLGSIDLFFVWWLVSLAIGLGVLYRRRTGPVATALLSVYVAIALIVAFVRSGS
jgi:hypothetical protein